MIIILFLEIDKICVKRQKGFIMQVNESRISGGRVGRERAGCRCKVSVIARWISEGYKGGVVTG